MAIHLEEYQELLDDPSLLEQAHALIATGKSAAFAWNAAIEATAEKPKPSVSAQSSRAVQKAPDCATSATWPFSTPLLAKVALSPIRGRMMPRQFGPISGISWVRAVSTISWVDVSRIR